MRLVKVEVEAFLAIERSLADRLIRRWQPYILKRVIQIEKAIRALKFNIARDLAGTLDAAFIAEKEQKALITFGKAAAAFGASQIATPDKSLRPQINDGVSQAVRVSSAIIARNLTDQVRKKMLAMIDGEEQRWHAAQQVVKEERLTNLDFIQPFVSFDPVAIERAGNSLLQLVSSLHSSRLSAYGYMLEAQFRGITEYAINAQLDVRVCPVCRVMHGRIFRVKDGYDALRTILAVDNPDDLKTLQPWPSHNEETVKRLAAASAAELSRQNLHLPPLHAHCRCLTVQTVDVPSIEQTESFRQAAILNPGIRRYVPIKYDFVAMGLPFDEQTLAEWAKYMSVSPRQVLGRILGVNQNLVTADLLQTREVVATIREQALTVEAATIGGTAVLPYTLTLPLGSGSAELKLKPGTDYRKIVTGLRVQLKRLGVTEVKVTVGGRPLTTISLV